MSEMEMRVSDQDRERTTLRLQGAFTEGRLTQLELEDRLELALTARTYGDLHGLVADLPDHAAVAGSAAVVLESKSGHIKRSGDWEVPRRLRVVTKYGSVELDLSGAVVPHPVVEIELDLKYGSAKILLPEGAAANVDGFRNGWGSTTSAVPSRPQSGGLLVVITGGASYGGLTVRHARKRWFAH